MDALSRSERQTEKHVEKRHVPLLAILGIVILLALLLGGIPAAIHYHEYTGVVVGVMLGIVAVGAFAYWIAFAGYYAIYCEEAKKAETAIAERDQAIAKEKGLREEIANEKQQEALRLKVSRLIQDGERLLQEYDAAVRSGGAAVLRPCADIGPWHREVIGLAKNEMVEHWLHFNDFQELVPENAARAKMPYREQVAGLIRRLTDVLGMFMVSPFRLGRFE